MCDSWWQENWTFADYLKLYNNVDVVGFTEYFKSFKIFCQRFSGEHKWLLKNLRNSIICGVWWKQEVITPIICRQQLLWFFFCLTLQIQCLHRGEMIWLIYLYIRHAIPIPLWTDLTESLTNSTKVLESGKKNRIGTLFWDKVQSKYDHRSSYIEPFGIVLSWF